jgi:hypothetical protein
MKRHKYKLIKNYKLWDSQKELEHSTISYFKRQNMSEFATSASFLVEYGHLPISKVGCFCAVSGRVRFAFKLTACARHVFFDR